MQECMDGMLLFYRNYRDLLSQALTWEQNGEYSRAIELLLQLTTQNCDDHDVLQQSWEKARIANFTVSAYNSCLFATAHRIMCFCLVGC